MIYFILAGIMLTLFIAFCAAYDELAFNCSEASEYVVTYIKCLGMTLVTYLIIAAIIGVILLFIWLIHQGFQSFK
jgi:hypothetical protein